MIKPQEEYTAAAILISSARGAEVSPKRPLAFVELDNKPIFVQAADSLAASKRFREIILLLHSEWVGLGVTTSDYWRLSIIRSILAGMEDKFESIRRGLHVLKDGYDMVCIHDGARPLTHSSLIANVMDEAYKHGAAVAVKEVSDVESFDQDPVFETGGKLYSIQSPLGIRQSILREIMNAVPEMTGGLSTLVELVAESGIELQLVESESENPLISITDDVQRCLNLIIERVKLSRSIEKI